MIRSRFLRPIFTCAVCMILIIGILLPITVRGAEPTSLRYENPSMESNRTISGAELLNRLYGVEVIPSEAEYLNSQAQFSFVYTDVIPNSLISTDYNGEAGELKVSALPYRFTASNGFLVEWIPVTASIGIQEHTLTASDGTYVCVFTDLFRSEDYDMRVLYRWQVELPETVCEELLNGAYRKGNAALTEILAYEAEKALYDEQLAAYEAYRDHLIAVEKYTAYEQKMKEYRELKAAYDIYAKAYEEYTTTLKQYQTWRDYWAYVKAEAEYPEKKKAYLQYDAEVQKVRNALAVMESLFVSDSNHWQHYASLMGNTVTSVVNRKGELVSAGCDPKHIDTAGNATVELRKLMKGYADIRSAKYASEHDRYTALYAYYTKHYTEIRDGYQALYGALIALYGNSIVVSGLSQEGKLKHFQQFVGQLYLTAVCLDDTQQPSDSWRISKKTLSDVLEQVNFVTDGDYADPKTNGAAMPAVEVEKVDEPIKVERPTYDDPLIKPKEPAPVAKPTEPQKVDPPSAVAPPKTEKPEEVPQEPQMQPLMRALAASVRSGELKERHSLQAQTLTFESATLFEVSISNVMTVTFYDVDGVTVLDRQQVEYGSKVEYSFDTPTREPSEQYIYREFLGWIEATGEEADLSCVTKNRSVYASYRTELRYYTVTWEIEGYAPLSTQHLYGEIPVYPNPLTKPSSQQYTYAFSGWDREVSAVRENTVYRASFIETLRKYTVTWDVEGVLETETYSYGEMPSYKGEIPQKAPDAYVYHFSGWSTEMDEVLGVVREDVTYIADFRRTAVAASPEGTVFDILWGEKTITVIATSQTVIPTEAIRLAMDSGAELILQWDGVSLAFGAEALELISSSSCKRIELRVTEDENGKTYLLRYLTNSGRDTALAVPATLRLDTDGDDGSSVIFYAQNHDSVSKLEDTVQIVGGKTLYARNAYTVSVTPIQDCDIASLPTRAEAGQTISLKLTCAYGYEVSGAIVTTEDGRQIAVNDLCFVMPKEAVKITLITSKIVYNVTFVVNGELYHSAEYGLGEAILLPTAPSMPADAQYSYTFRGWSGWPSEGDIAAGENRDIVYTAEFSKVSLLGEDPYKMAGNSNRLLTIGLPIIGGVALLAVVYVILSKKGIIPKKGAKASETNETKNKIE